MHSLVLAVRKRKGEPGRLKFSRQHFLTQRLALFNKVGCRGCGESRSNMPAGSWEAGKKRRFVYSGK